MWKLFLIFLFFYCAYSSETIKEKQRIIVEEKYGGPPIYPITEPETTVPDTPTVEPTNEV